MIKKISIIIILSILLTSCSTTSVITLPDDRTIVFKGQEEEKVFIKTEDGMTVEFDRKPIPKTTSEGSGLWNTVIAVLTLGLVD